jgi:hypothetical protein
MDRKSKCHGLSLTSVMVVTVVLVMALFMCLQSDLAWGWILGLGLAATIAPIWLAIRILKDPFAPDTTFDEAFYSDRPDLRRNGKR